MRLGSRKPRDEGMKGWRDEGTKEVSLNPPSPSALGALDIAIFLSLRWRAGCRGYALHAGFCCPYFPVRRAGPARSDSRSPFFHGTLVAAGSRAVDRSAVREPMRSTPPSRISQHTPKTTTEAEANGAGHGTPWPARRLARRGLRYGVSGKETGTPGPAEDTDVRMDATAGTGF